MKLENKGLLVSVFIIILSVVFFFAGTWMFSKLYIYPLLESDVSKVTADPLMIVSFLIGSSLGMLIVAPVNVASRLFRSKELKIKTIAILLCIFGIAGIGSNAALYQLVISPSNMLECPKKIGYKKNLMRDYVIDISLCEKF